MGPEVVEKCMDFDTAHPMPMLCVTRELLYFSSHSNEFFPPIREVLWVSDSSACDQVEKAVMLKLCFFLGGGEVQDLALRYFYILRPNTPLHWKLLHLRVFRNTNCSVLQLSPLRFVYSARVAFMLALGSQVGVPAVIELWQQRALAGLTHPALEPIPLLLEAFSVMLQRTM